MKICGYVLSDGSFCESQCEGTTFMCATHNKQQRDLIKREQKESEKRKLKMSAPKPKRVPVNKVSDKQKERLEIYNARVKEWKVENPKCKATINEFCTKETQDNHHMKGKIGELLFDEKYWLPCCRSCHDYIGQHPLDALKRGLSLSRLAKDENT